MDYAQIEKITERVRAENLFVQEIKTEIEKVVIGQASLIDRILITFISGGHILLEGLPGLAKTLAVRAFARAIDTDFKIIGIVAKTQIANLMISVGGFVPMYAPGIFCKVCSIILASFKTFCSKN